MADRGPALFLYDRYDRIRFAIHRFEPSDTDYLFQGEFAAQIYGSGLRGRLYHAWWTRTEILNWVMNALQRLSINGMLVGFYESGDDAAKVAMLKCLKMISEFSFGIMPRKPGDSDPTAMIHNIQPTTVGYDIMKAFVEYFDTIIEEVLLGRLDSYGATGDAALEYINSASSMNLRADGDGIDSTITTDILKPLLSMNIFKYKRKMYRGDDLPFQMRYKSVIDKDNVLKRLQGAQLLHGMEAQLDEKQLLKIGGFKRPETPEDALGFAKAQAMQELQQQQMAQQQAMQGPAMGGAAAGAPPQPGAGGAPAGAEGLPAGPVGVVPGAPPEEYAGNGIQRVLGAAPGPGLHRSRADRPRTFARQGEAPTPPRLERSMYRYEASTSPERPEKQLARRKRSLRDRLRKSLMAVHL
jgi:hypothetical protein